MGYSHSWTKDPISDYHTLMNGDVGGIQSALFAGAEEACLLGAHLWALKMSDIHCSQNNGFEQFTLRLENASVREAITYEYIEKLQIKWYLVIR